MHTPTHRPLRRRYRQSPIRHIAPPPATALPAAEDEGEVTPEQVWQGLSPLLQAATRRTALRILREVTDDGR